MAFQTRAALGILAQQVADETAPGANTADRVGTILQNIIDSAPNYISYAANFTQSATGAPTVVVASALPQGNIVWTRSSQGIYIGTLAGAFPLGKVPPVSNLVAASSTITNLKYYSYERIDNNSVLLGTTDNGSPADGVLSSTFIEIRVYP